MLLETGTLMAIPELKNKNVLITGAASGIGRAALAFARSDARKIGYL